MELLANQTALPDFQPVNFPPLNTTYPGVKTLILTHEARLAERYPVTTAELITAVQTLAEHPAVAGQIIDLGNLPAPYPADALSNVYETWDENADNPFYANLVAISVKQFLATIKMHIPT